MAIIIKAIINNIDFTLMNRIIVSDIISIVIKVRRYMDLVKGSNI